MNNTEEAKGRPRILIVDDDVTVLHSINRILDSDIYEVMTASSADEGFAVLKRCPVQVVMADYRMPGMDGVNFLTEVCRQWPETVRMVLSGYADIQSIIDAINEGQVYKFITKPWNNEDLRITIGRAVERYELQRKNEQLVTDLKKSLDKLQESKLLYQTLTDKSFAGVYVLRDGKFKYINDKTADYVGYTVEELIDKPADDLVYPEDKETAVRQANDILRGRRQEPHEFRVVTKDGRIRWLIETLVPITYEGGFAVLGNCMDITFQKETEKKLRDSEQALKSIIEGSSIPTFVIGRELKVIFWNKALEKLSGIKAEEVVGTSDHWRAFYRESNPCMADLIINGNVDEFTERYGGSLKAFPLIEDAYESTDFFPSLGESGRWLHLTAAPVRNATGELIGAMETLEDVTDLKLYEGQLAQQIVFEQKLLDAIPQPVFYKDINGIYIGCNAAYEKFINMPRAKIIGRSVFDIAPKKLADVYHAKDEELFSNPGTQTYESRVIDSTRRVHDIIFQKATFTDPEGNIAGLIGAIFDITEQKSLERKLLESEELHRSISEKSFAGIYIVQDGVFKFANAMAASYSGYKPEEIIGKRSNEIVYGEDREMQNRSAIDMLKGIRKEPYEFRIVSKDGRLRWLIEMVSAITYEGRQAILGNCMDITPQQTAEMKMKESEERYRLLTEKSFAGVYIVQDRVFRYINAAAAGYAGFTSDELEGKPSQALLVHPDDLKSYSLQASRMLKGIRKEPLEFRILTKKGQIRWIMETLAPIVYEGRPAILGNSMDITAQKQAEEELVSTMKQLEKAYAELAGLQANVMHQQKMASIGQLSAGIAHEINNPIGFISGNLGVLETYAGNLEKIIRTQEDVIRRTSSHDSVTELETVHKKLKIDHILGDIYKLIEESVSGAERVKKIVKELMTFSMTRDMEHKPDDINGAVMRIIDIMISEFGKKISFKKNLETIPPVRCNIGQISQVFMNIMNNAVQAIEVTGEINVQSRSDGESVYIIIADNGCGIPENILPRIFEPFFTSRDVGQGMGLGLSTAYEIVKKHNGEITVNSEVGKGTTVTVRLPVVT